MYHFSQEMNKKDNKSENLLAFLFAHSIKRITFVSSKTR